MSSHVPSGMIHFLGELTGLWKRDPRSDAELLAAFVDGGDEAAFTAMVIRHGRAVWNTCRRVLTNDADAEDAFQATFIALARKAARLRRETLDGWLHRVAQQAALDVAKVARRRSEAHSRLYKRAAPDRAETRPSEEELRAAVHEEMAHLPEKLRAPLALYYLDGKTQAEVGSLLGISDRAVSNRLERALNLLRQRLAKQGLVVTTAALVALVSDVPVTAAIPAGLMAAAATTALQVLRGAPIAGTAVMIATGLVASRTSLMAILSAAGIVSLLAAVTGGTVYLASARPANSTPAFERPELAALSSSLPSTPAEGPLAVRGQVLDQEGRPVPHAKVALLAGRSVRGEFGRRDDLLQHGEADNTGRFTLEVPDVPHVWRPDRRQVKLLAAVPGQAVGAVNVALRNNMPSAEVRLTPQAIRGRVVDADGHPVPGVAVHVVRVGPVCREPMQGEEISDTGPLAWPRPVVTNGHGHFVLAGFDPRQDLSLEVRDPRFARQRAMLGPTVWGTRSASAVPTRGASRPHWDASDLTIRLAPPQAFEGQVFAADTGKPLPHARVSLVPCEPRVGLPGLREHVDARADANGRFSVQPLPGTAFKVFACAPEGAPYQMIEQTVRWPAGTVRQELKLSLPPGVALRGQVVDAATSKPVPWAQVEYIAHLTPDDVPEEKDLPRLAGGGREWTGRDGRFLIAAHTGRGLLQVYVPLDKYLMPAPDPKTLPVEDRELYAYIPAAATLPLNLPPNCRSHEVRVSLQPARTLQGRVLDEDGSPLAAGRVITAGPFAHYAGTDARRFDVRDGAFQVPNAHPGVRYPLVVLDAAREQGVLTSTVAGQASQPRLQPCGTATGRLLGDNQEPLADVALELAAVLSFARPGQPPVEMETNWRQALGLDTLYRTDSLGGFTFSSLVPGVRYRLYAGVYGSRRRLSEFTAASGETLDLRLTPTHSGAR